MTDHRDESGPGEPDDELEIVEQTPVPDDPVPDDSVTQAVPPTGPPVDAPTEVTADPPANTAGGPPSPADPPPAPHLAAGGPDPVAPPPSAAPPVPPASSMVRRSGPAPWPPSARTFCAILLVLALAGLVGTIIGFTRDTSDETDDSELVAQRDAALAQAEQAERERDALAAENEDLERRVELLTMALEGAEAERDLAERARDEQLAANALLAEAVETLEGQVAERDELIDSFPLGVDLALTSADVVGAYVVSLTEIACTGLDTCGTPPTFGTSSIVNEGGLRFQVPDQLDVPLAVVAGTPFGPAEFQTLVPACGDVPREPVITVGLFADEVVIGLDGVAEPSRLGGTMVVEAPAVADCDAVAAWYRMTLAPTG